LCGTATYGYEDWTIRKSEESQIAAFQNEWAKADPMDSQEKPTKWFQKKLE